MPPASVDRPRPSRLAARVFALGTSCAVISTFFGNDAFVGLSAYHRPSGQLALTDMLPKTTVRRSAYGDPDREEWLPLPQWRGEKSYHPSRELQADENRQWYFLDAEGKALGVLAQTVAMLLKGKNSPLYDPIRDVGAFVIVTNCEKVRVSRDKYHTKLYFRNHARKPGCMKVERFKDLQKRFPERIIMKSVWGSMAKTKSSRRIFNDRLKLFAGPNHNFYDKDPIQYPMHLIRDVTAKSCKPKHKQFIYWKTVIDPRRRLAKKEKWLKKAAKREVAYKDFLLEEYDKLRESGVDEETLANMDMSELELKAEASRFQKKLDEWGDRPNPLQPTIYYPGTTFPRKKIFTIRGSLKQWALKR